MDRLITVTGDATPDVAWERYARFALWPTWSPQIRGVDTSAERIRTGVTGTVRGPLGSRVHFHILSVDEADHSWAWRVRAAFLRVDMAHRVDSAATGGSSTFLRIDGPVAAALIYPLLARPALRRLVAAEHR